MENAKYAEFTGKVVEIDKKLDAARRDADNAICEMVKDMSRIEIDDWAKMALDDDRVSPQIYHLVLMVFSDEFHKKVADIKNAIDKL